MMEIAWLGVWDDGDDVCFVIGDSETAVYKQYCAILVARCNRADLCGWERHLRELQQKVSEGSYQEAIRIWGRLALEGLTFDLYFQEPQRKEVLGSDDVVIEEFEEKP